MCPLQDSASKTLLSPPTPTLHLLRVHLASRVASAARDREQTLQFTARPSAASKYTVALVICKLSFSLLPFGRGFLSLLSPGLGNHLCAEGPALSTISGGRVCPTKGFSLGVHVYTVPARCQFAFREHGVCRGALAAPAAPGVHDVLHANIAGAEEQDGARRRAREGALRGLGDSHEQQAANSVRVLHPARLLLESLLSLSSQSVQEGLC